jgi:hypothetical protein
MIWFLLIHICSLGVSRRTLLHDQLHLEFRGMCLILILCSSLWWWWLCNISVEVWHWFYQLNLLRYIIVNTFDVHWGFPRSIGITLHHFFGWLWPLPSLDTAQRSCSRLFGSLTVEQIASLLWLLLWLHTHLMCTCLTTPCRCWLTWIFWIQKMCLLITIILTAEFEFSCETPKYYDWSFGSCCPS